MTVRRAHAPSRALLMALLASLSVFASASPSARAAGDPADAVATTHGPSGRPVIAGDPLPGAVIAELPFVEAGEPNRVIVDLAAEGHRPLPLMLDTGATDSVLTVRMAAQLGIRPRRTKSTPYRRRTRLGRELQFWIDTKKSDTGSAAWEYGLLGGNFLADYVVEIDFAGRRVRFLDPRRYRVPERVDGPDETVLRLQIPSKRPHATLRVQGREIRALLDTGDPFSLGLTTRWAENAGISIAPVAGLEIWGVLGPYRGVRLGNLAQLEFGALRLRNVPVTTTASGYNQGDATGAVVGHDVLSRFLVRIDYPRRRLWLRATEGVSTFLGEPWEPARRSGVIAVREDAERLRVDYVVEGSPGWERGLRPGDRVGGPGGVNAETLAGRIEREESLDVMRPAEGGYTRVELPPAHPGP